MSLNLTEAWKDVPPPSPSGTQDSAEAASGPPPAPDSRASFLLSPGAEAQQTSPLLGAFGNVQDATDAKDRENSLLSAFPRQAATPLSPAHPRSLFDSPLTRPLLPSSAPSVSAYKPDPQRIEELHALILHNKQDPELATLLERNPAFRAQAALDDGSMPARALLGQQILREIAGEKYAGEPGFYFLALKEKLPQTATRQEAYAAVYDHYSRVLENQYKENRKRRAAYQKNREQVEEAVARVVGGLWSPSDLNDKLTPEQLSVYGKEFDSAAIEKAHAAFSFLKQAFSDTPDAGLRRMVSERTAMKITSALSDDDGSGKLTINETAFQLFEGALKNLMERTKEETGDQYKFLHNLRIALFNPVVKRDATLGASLQLSGQQNLLVPFAREHNKQVFGLMAQTVQDYETYVKNDKENARVLGLLSTGQDLGNQASDRASFAARTVNCLGSVTGQTLPFFIPYAGWGIALAEAFDDKRNRAYYAGLQPGTAEWSAFIDAAASTAVEKISFGAIGKFSGAGWLINKLPAANKLRRTLSDALWTRVLFETGAGIAEETVAEPTAEAIIQWVVRNNLAPLVNLNVGGNYDWNNYWQELQGMLSPDQFAATALFVGGLAGMQAPSLHRSLITYSKNEEMLMTQGIPKEEARRIAAIENDKERIAAARQARGKAWENHDQALKNAKAGMAAFRHLGEVQATIESEAYKYFQKQYNLPTVEERLDKPGTYAVTVYDRDSGKKKFTQDMTGDQLVALFGQYFSRAEQQEVRKTQSEFAANAFLRAAEATGEIQAQDMLQWGQDNNKDGRKPEAENASTPRQPQTEAPVQDTPSPAQQEKPAPATTDTQETAAVDSAPAQKTETETETAASLTTLGGFVRVIGAMSQTAFTHLTRIATQEYMRRTDSGMSAQEAAATPFAALSPYVPLSSIMALDQEFGQRLRIGAKTTGEENFKYTRLFKMRTAPGTTPADTLFLLARGNIGSRELLEDLFEWKLGKITLKDPVRLQAIASLLHDTQASMRQLGFKGQFVEPKGELSDMQIVEAMSKLALSDMLSNADSLPLPQWQKDLLQYHVNTLGDAAYLLHIGQAYNAGRKAGTITQDMADILRDLGHEVHTVFDSAKIEQADIQAVMDARAIIDGRAPSGTPTASQIRERQQKDAEEEKAHITTGDKGKERSVPKEVYRHPETISLPEAPSSMQGVFANGAAWNPDAGTWLGMVPVDKLHLSPEVPQVKVNSGKKGVVNPLVGDYRADAPPIYAWKRKNGRLEVVSGRHRLDLAQRTGTKNIPAYVYEEDAAHDAKWARLLDYEQNMQDDQADELTAAIYVRETSLTDDELTRRGLTRSGTKSRRGLLIGREAREDLWTRFKSGAIRAQDAEAICLLTQHIQDKARIDAMQTAAANDLARGKSLEFVAAKIQLMAHASADGQMVQGLISFGESFEADMEKAAEYVSLCITTINEHINAIKGVRTISKKGSVLSTEGITAGLSADPAERLKELELLKAMYEKIGLYENLRVRALTWDGHTPPDPIGDHRLDMQTERARAEEEAAALENEENRKASEALTPELTFSLTPSRDLETTFPSLWGQAARELNARGQVSFSLNGSHVAIHTLSEEKMRHVLKLGGMPNPAIQIADLDSGPTYYAEIACILHPDRIDPAKTPGARIWRGDAWTRQMPEKISEDGDPWEGYEHGPEEIPWFYDEHGDLREWNRENLDAYMKAKHLESFLPHNMTPDEVLDNYGTDGAALPIIMASQAYAAEFPSLKEALRTDNLSFQLDRHEAETATRQLEDQFKALLGSCYFEPRSLQHFLIGYWWRDISHENVRDALIGEGLLDDPDTVYDEEENPEEYNDLQSSNDYIAEEVRAFLDACRTSAKIYYEAVPGGWLFPSDFSGFILPSSLGPSLRSELEKYNVPIHTYDLTEQEALTLGNPWTLAKASWLREEVDERRNEAIRSFLEVHDISFSLSGAEERDDPSAFLPHSSPSPDFPLALSPVRLSSSFHAVEQASPVTLAIPASAREDKTQGFSKLARQAFTALREKTRQRTLFANGREKTSEQLKPPLLMPDGRRIYLSNRGWKHIMATSPETRTLAAIGALEPLLASARYMYSVPEFDNASPDQTKSWHYYLGKIRDSLHGPGYVLFTFREDTRGCYLEGVETAAAAALDKTGSASSQVDFGATRRATGRSLPVRTLLSLKQFVNFIDKGGAEAFRAPNGQPSRLAPDQWHLVRTAPFMRYFGDWLRDPSASSVVLDDNGEPRVCYRGLKQSYNPGVRRNYTWISSSRELSEQYAAGGTVLDLFVATRRPFHFPDSLTRQSPEHFRENIRRQLEQDRALGFFAEEQLQEASRKLETLLQGTEETEAFKIWERHRELKDILSSLGYDSVMTEENGVMTYGLFRPGQAKSAVGNCGSYDITLPDITFALTPREQRTAAQALVEDTFLRAPDGTLTALTERQWLQVNSAAFKKWFGQSKVVNAHGEPLIVYHGTARKDRVGTVFRPERATSGPMAFFTDSPEIASNYSRDKTDTSIDYEEEDYHDYHRQFRVTLPSGRDIPLERYWNYLSPEERQRIARTAGHIRTDWEGDDSIILDPSTDEANGGFRFHLQEARGNALRALVYHWLDSATFFGQEARFLDVLAKLDLPIAPWYRDPDYTEPGVYACYLHMEHPFRTNGITGKILTSLKAASRKAGNPAQKGGLLSWSKNDLAPETWIDILEEDVKNGTTYAWTTIPDWVTACLKRLGYDGIIDQGGKFHSDIHTVYIPFSPYQLKSATDNNGSFDSGNPDISFALSPEERLITEQAKADGTWLQAPNGQPSLLEPKLWATVRTRAFRDWFGDWLRAPEQSSRVVDVNGEPLPVYHGSHRAGFTIFDTALGENPSQFGTPDDCYFFSDSRQVAITYCKLEDPASAREAELPALSVLAGQRTLFPAVYTCFINIRLPLEADFQGNYWDGRDAEDTSGEGDIPTTNTIALEAREQGYDAAIIRNVIDMGDDAPYHLPSTVYSVFDPSQIKSAYANRGTFDSGNPDITFSLWDDAEDSYTVMERSASPLTAEEQSILARARDAGNDLLAPNGQPTRLTEKQWAQARTKAFLAWFGDWLHDPANASKTLDENGEPIVLYHGGSFDIRRSPSVFDGVPHVDGIFFSDSTELAKSYQAYQGGGITTAWLNLKNPFLSQDEASARLPWVDRYIDYWQVEEGWTDRYSGESMDRESVRDMIREGSLYEYDMGNRWSDFLGWVREHHDGYLGHDPTDMGVLIAVAFKSTQVKSSEYNSGAFSASEPDITFSLSNLAAIHSLDEEKFLAVDKLGGLPLPSIAVSRLDRPYTWGGEGNIYLVGSPALADPARGVEIHDRDAWSGYFPKLRWSRQEEKEREDFYNQAQEAALRYYGGTDISTLRFLKNALDGDHRGELENKLRHNDSSLAVFAAERGYSPRPVTAKIPGRLNTGDKIFYAEIRKMLPWKDANTLSPDRQDDFCKAMERAIERYRSQFSQDSRDAQLTVPQTLTRKSNLRAMEKELREARGDGFQSISYLALQDARQAGKKALDSHANYKRFEKYAAQHKKAFNAWVEDKLARWLNPVPRIRETGLPATLENITRHMLESKGMGAERGLVFSTGLLRARQARRFNSLEEIKASRNNLVTTEEEKASQQKAQDLIHQFQMALSRIDGSFSAFDNAVKALSLVRGAPTPQKVLAALCRLYRRTSFQGRIARDSRLPGLGSAALSALHAELRDYYEAVPRRSVQLREFSHAVLPAALRKNKQVRDVLKRHQIRPLYHDGTREGRFQALASLIGSSASFSLAPGPSWLRLPDSDYMASLSEEERAITETALASGAWLKAPNGEPSRLTPRQWAQVRTAAFHDWFGDWQHDPAHASRVVDENGEPRVVYHGTRESNDFTVFDSAKIGDNWGPGYYGNGFYFSGNRKAAYHYGHKELACFLNIRHPYLSPRYNHAGEKRFTKILKKKGYDGVIAENALRDVYDWEIAEGREYVVFEPSQIKSATDNIGTFDPSSPDITFSVIGPHAATWEQYKKNTFRGRDDGMYRAEIDASQATLKDRAAPYLPTLRRELSALRHTLSAETKKRIARYLSLHRQFYRNKRTLRPENNISKWREYLTLDHDRESWGRLLSAAVLRTGLYSTSPLAASGLAEQVSSLELLLREDDGLLQSLATLAAANTALPLDAWLDYPELFAAYPALRSMPVILQHLSGYLGMYSPAERAIYIHRNLDAPQQLRSILLHEVQHAIQHIEGFAWGGTRESAKLFYESMRKAAYEAYDQASRFMSWLNARDGMISTLEYMLSLARNPRRVLRTSYRYSYDGISHRLTGEERILDMARYALKDLSGLLEQFYDKSWSTDSQFELPWPGNYALNTPAGIKECLAAAKATPSRRLAYRRTPKPDMAALHRDFLKYERLSSLSPYELYRRLAGEIEAYAVERRSGLSAGERAESPFNDALEYPGEALVSFSLSPADIRPSEEFLSSLTEEERTLADAAWEGGSWLLAPNGQPTRLTPRQWLQVRTAAFRDWFGDWEHDPLEASRVTDGNGEPLVVYHGSRHAGFTVFDSSEGESHSDAPAGSSFFTDNPLVARSYSGTREEPDLHDPSSLEGVYSPPGLYPCFLNLRDLWDVDFKGANWDGNGQPLFEFYDKETEDFIYPPNGGDFWESEEAVREYAEANSYTDYEIYNVEGHRTTNTIVQDAINMGLDGAVIRNVIDMGSYAKGKETESDIYVALRPEQIKSATQNRGAFDPRNPDITFSLASSLAVQQSITSEETSMRQVARTFNIVRNKFGGWKKGSVNIDIGGGKYDDFTKALEREGVASYVYDPFARHASHNAPVLRNLRRGTLKGDTATCNNVLNVIPERTARFNVIHQVAKSLKPEGTAWFCVYEGDGSGAGRVTKTRSGKAACWQENRKTASYLEEIRPFFGEVEIKHGLIRARAPRRTESPASWRLGGNSPGSVTFSLSSLREQGLFTRGVLPVQNALVTSPGSTFSLTAEHASPYSFRRFSTSRRTKGVGALSYGWGLYFTASPLRALRYEQEFQAQKQRTPVYFADGQEVHPSGADEEDILDELATNGWESLNSYLEENRGNEQFYAAFHPLLEQYRGKTVERRFVTPPSSSVTTYRVELNVDEADLLPWEEPVPPDMREKILSALRRDYPQIAESLTHNTPEPEEGDAFYDALAHELDKEQASKWLLAQGIKGIRFDNLNTGEGAPYDYVIFDENDIKITAVRDASTHWQNFTPYHDASASFSVIGPHAVTWGKYAERAFAGRDDGKMRAEIDASQARLNLENLRQRDYSGLEEITAAFTARPDIKPLIGTRAARFYSQAREASRAFRAGAADADGLREQYQQLLRQYGFRREAELADPDEFNRAITGLGAPSIRAVRGLWDFFRNHPLTGEAVSRIDREKESREAAFNNLVFFLESGDYRFIHAIFPQAGPYRTWLLGEVLDYPELFEAYPVLKGIRVDLRNELLHGAMGEFFSPENRISLSMFALENHSPENIKSYLLHEAQHAIQEMEGFASGGNLFTGAHLFFKEQDHLKSALNLYLAHLTSGVDHLEEAFGIARNPEQRAEETLLYKQRLLEGQPMSDERKRALAVHFLEKALFRARDYLHEEAPEGVPSTLRFPVEQIALPTAQEAVKDKGASLRRAITRANDLLIPLFFASLEEEQRYMERAERFKEIGGHIGAYLRVAGEIESRNVERRMNWTEERRSAEPFNGTLEYPGEAMVSFSPLSGPAGTTFSLTSLEEIVSGLAAPSMQATRASELVKDFGKAAENWRRVMSGKEEKPSARVGAELFGMINSLLSSARYVLPKGYRSNVDLQMQWAAVYAAMAESGEIPPKGTLRSGDSFYKKFETSMINATTSAATPEEVRQILASIGSQRLDHVMSKVLDRVRTQLVYFAKDELYQKTMRRVEAVYPKKEPGKKSPRGRLEAAAYRTLARYRQMLDAQSQAKAEAMTTLEALYNQEEDEEKRQEHERDILAWKTYGDYAGMSLPQAREAMEKLLEFILSGRNSWERKLTREAGRIKYAARQIQKNLPAVNSGSSRAGAKISHRTKLRKLLSSLPYSVMSYAQLMLALEPVLGQHFSRARIKEITEANASLLNASNDRSAWLSGTIRRIAGVKSESAAEQWLVQFNTPQATGIPIAPVLTVKVSLSIEDAQEWLSLSSQEREARRQAIREEDRRTETLTENVPGEEDIPLLRQALDEYESRTPEQRQYQHNVTSEREVPNTEAASQLICSRDCALYAILLHEQPDYADVYDSEGNLIRKGFLRREGLDDKGIGDLYDYVGPDGLEYGYALRRKLNETGLTLAQVYEERMGVPFTLKPDYFRATFDRNSTREKDALTEPKTGSIGGGKYGLLIDRVVHSENLDFSKSGTLVFLAAAAEQDNYIYTSHITTAWRALLKNKPLEQKLKQHLGEDMMGKLSSWMDLIDGASLENNRAFLNLSRMQGMLQKAFAISVLAGNGYVLLKQATAILHGFFAGWVPSAILEKADGTRELAHKHISFSSFLFHLAASKLGLGDIAMKEVAATPYFTARMRGEGAMLAQLGNQMPGQRYSRMEKLPEKSMDLIEAVDVKANLLAMHALANAYYARSRSLNRENGSPFTDEELRQAALEQVGMSLELGAQPLTKTQKSMSQAAGGILSKLAFVMKSEQLNKIGLMAAEWKTGSARNRVCAAQSWLALGVTSSLLAWFIAWIKGMEDDDDDKAKKWKKYGATALLGDLTTIPLAGEGVNYLASLFTGEHVFADSYARTLIDVQGIARTITREYEHVADKKEMDWDTHFNNLTALVRAAGVGGAFSRSSSAIVSSYGALSLSAATGANISRTAKDLLTRLFGTPEEDRKKKKKKHKRKPKK